MDQEDNTDFNEFAQKLGPLPKDIREKAIALARGMISVYGLSKEVALEEAIKRAQESFEKKESQLKNRLLANKLIK